MQRIRTTPILLPIRSVIMNFWKKQRKNFLVENREFGSNKANEDTMNTKTNGFDREAKPKMDGRRRV